MHEDCIANVETMLRYVYGFEDFAERMQGAATPARPLALIQLDIAILADKYGVRDLRTLLCPQVMKYTASLTSAQDLVKVIETVSDRLDDGKEYHMLKLANGLVSNSLKALLESSDFKALLSRHPSLSISLMKRTSRFTSLAREQILACFECGTEFVCGYETVRCPACERRLSDVNLGEGRMCWVDGKVPWSVKEGMRAFDAEAGRVSGAGD